LATGTPAAIAQTAADAPINIQRVQSVRDRVARLQGYIDSGSWESVRAYIRGPLGQIRRDVSYALPGLPSQAKAEAKKVAERFFDDLIAIDFAARDRDLDAAQAAYRKATADCDALLDLVRNS